MREQGQDLTRRLDTIEKYVVRIAYTISLIVTVVMLLTVELQQVLQVLRSVVGR